ncbi:hypothetical protein IEQ34_016136 [Dendrobium chrysotoxum]|uniref:Alpha-1,4 glucan phosphorylase n=1 Tax=Dendrobium chrysotoxum TaxID=161865 RepID=A0AAV7GDH9_DENCH|nr:hypothetical protein IEQ34_016136 [Dendrobium chrysotoxum]
MALTEKDNESTLVCLSKEFPAVAHPCAEQPSEITSNIVYHAQYSPHFSPLKFDPEQAFYATALSVRDNLIQRWNDTYLHFHKLDPKQTYYLSMEYLQGRALTNAIGNLDIQGAYADALKKLGHEIEEIAEKEKDAALGNGGLGRLASCFLDSMATLNLPAWGYGLRYRYGLFKQKISKEGQEEVAEDWLEKFSPWEVARHDVIFPVRFFGHVEISSTGLYCVLVWLKGQSCNMGLHSSICQSFGPIQMLKLSYSTSANSKLDGSSFFSRLNLPCNNSNQGRRRSSRFVYLESQKLKHYVDLGKNGGVVVSFPQERRRALLSVGVAEAEWKGFCVAWKPKELGVAKKSKEGWKMKKLFEVVKVAEVESREDVGLTPAVWCRGSRREFPFQNIAPHPAGLSNTFTKLRSSQNPFNRCMLADLLHSTVPLPSIVSKNTVPKTLSSPLCRSFEEHCAETCIVSISSTVPHPLFSSAGMREIIEDKGYEGPRNNCSSQPLKASIYN